MKKNIISLLCLITCCFSLAAQDFKSLFNDKISNEDLQKLSNGETVIRNIGTIKKLSLKNSNNDEYLTQIYNELSKLNPNYLAEIIKIVPKNTESNLISTIESEILNIENYANIPYYSVRNKKWYDLYDSAEINSITGTDEEKTLDFTVEMTPFGIINMNGKVYSTQNSLYFYMKNTNKVVYENMNITCVKPQKMYCAIYLFENDNEYILYGVGGVNGPSIFFLKDRIDTAFIGRIKSFCTYMFDQIKIN